MKKSGCLLTIVKGAATVILAYYALRYGAVAYYRWSPDRAIQRVDQVARESWIVPGDPVPTPGDIAEAFRLWAPTRALTNNPKALSDLLAAMDNASYKSRTRGMCAEFALGLNPTPEQREHIKKSLLALVSEKQFMYRFHLLLDVLGGTFSADPEVQRYLLATLEKDEDEMLSSFLLQKMTKNKVPGIIPIIERRLKAPDRKLIKVRAYLGLGSIGGKEAFEVLARALPTEKDNQGIHQILMAMGATKDPRSKPILVSHLKFNDDITIYGGALDGLSYLGDKNALPDLELALKQKLRPVFRQHTLKAIQDIQAGGRRYEF